MRQFDVASRELAETIKEVVGYRGRLSFDCTKPDGTSRKLRDESRMKTLGWEAQEPLRRGIGQTYDWCVENQTKL